MLWDTTIDYRDGLEEIAARFSTPGNDVAREILDGAPEVIDQRTA